MTKQRAAVLCHYATDDGNMAVLQQLSQEFLGAFEQQNYKAAAALIPKIKLEYAKTGLLTPSRHFQPADLLAARQLLELAVFVSIHAGWPHAETERLIAEVRPFYDVQLGLPASPSETKIIALYLLLLLTGNNISEFHTELETLEDPENDKFLRYPVLLERWLMEGAYDKAWRAVTESTQFPSPEFAILTKSNPQNMEMTIRNEIAQCAEKGYTSLPVASAKHLLYLKSDAELESFVAERKSRGWELSQGRITFTNTESAAAAAIEEEGEELASEEKMVSNMLGYTAQIEVII